MNNEMHDKKRDQFKQVDDFLHVWGQKEALGEEKVGQILVGSSLYFYTVIQSVRVRQPVDLCYSFQFFHGTPVTTEGMMLSNLDV